MASRAGASVRDTTFEQRMTLGLAAFILFGFGQFAARGFVDYRAVPLIFHFHGMAMTAWLCLLVAQSFLAGRASIALHRTLGWFGVGFVFVIYALASATCITALRQHFVPPFFSNAYFLLLVHLEGALFVGMVLAAVTRRRRTDWHRRLMIGATVLLMEPALGRLLPMPLLGPWGEWLAMVVQLGALGIVMRHDRRTLGRIHPATLTSVAVLVSGHVLVTLLALAPPVIAFADRIAA